MLVSLIIWLVFVLPIRKAAVVNQAKFAALSTNSRHFRAVFSKDAWKQHQIFYVYDHSLYRSPAVETCVQEAMREIERHSCVTFQALTAEKLTNLTTTYLRIIQSDEPSVCEWRPARKRDMTTTTMRPLAEDAQGQEIRLGTRCGSKIQVCLHEILHALGFEHEHERLDRDEYITINTTNVKRRHIDDFNHLLSAGGNNVLTPYDLSSVMHYGAKEFSDNHETVIATKNPMMEFSIGSSIRGTRDPLSDRDKKALNQVFQCAAKCTTLPDAPKCLHGGYLNANCSCVCPERFSGRECQLLKYARNFNVPGCGTIQQKFGHIKSPNYPQRYPNSVFCQWLIQTTKPTEVVRFKIDHIDLEYEGMIPSDRCKDSLQVWPHGTDVITKSLSCLPEEVSRYTGQWFTTQYNWLLLEFRSEPWGEYNHSGFSLVFDTIDTAPIVKVDMQADATKKNITQLSFDPTLIDLNRNYWCYRCRNESDCASEILSSVRCPVKHLCAWDTNEHNRVTWRDCSPFKKCLHSCVGEQNNQCFDCCYDDYCNAATGSLVVPICILLVCIFFQAATVRFLSFLYI